MSEKGEGFEKSETIIKWATVVGILLIFGFWAGTNIVTMGNSIAEQKAVNVNQGHRLDTLERCVREDIKAIEKTANENKIILKAIAEKVGVSYR